MVSSPITLSDLSLVLSLSTSPSPSREASWELQRREGGNMEQVTRLVTKFRFEVTNCWLSVKDKLLNSFNQYFV